MVINMNGVTCKECGRNELELEKVSIPMHIHLETCNECCKKKAAETQVEPEKKLRVPTRYRKAHRLIEDAVVKYDAVLGSDDPRDVMDLKEMAESFLELLTQMEKLVNSEDTQ